MNLKALIKNKIKALRYLIEAAFVGFGFFLFEAIGLKNSAEVAAKTAKFIGKKISVHKLAYKNLSNAIPNLNEAEKEKILDDMWDNLGRVIGEYAYVSKFSASEVMQHVNLSQETKDSIAYLKNNNRGGIIFSGHIGNWELGPKILIAHDLKVGTVYRSLNNPYVEKMTSSIRRTELISKTTQGNRRIIEIIKNKGYVIILADQKISEGAPIKFFHDLAITTTSIARIALKYDVPLIPARIVRNDKDFNFTAEVEKPLEIQRSDNINEDILKLTLEINRKLENWIREYPAQWFWVHNRWKR